MAKKEPETIDRFRITSEVSKEQLGHVIAEMTKLGLEHVSYELITDVINYRKRQTHAVTATDLLREWIKEHPTFRRAEVVKHFADNGRTQSSGVKAIYQLVSAKEIKSLGEGNYQRADIKAIAAPKKAKAAVGSNKRTGKPLLRTPRKLHGNYDVPNLDFIMRHVRQRAKFTLKEIEDYFEQHGRPRKSVSALLTVLLSAHKIRRIGPGEYASVKARDQRKRSTKTPVLNGAAAAQAAEVATNG